MDSIAINGNIVKMDVKKRNLKEKMVASIKDAYEYYVEVYGRIYGYMYDNK